MLRLGGVAATLAAGAISALCAACGDASPPVQTASLARAPEPPAPPFPESTDAWGSYRSLRFALRVPLPDPRAWRVDDASRAELIATEARTRSTLTLLEETEPSLVNHKQCEERARTLRLAPARPLRIIEDTVTVGPEAFDTRIVVGIEARGAEGPLVGHVLAWGAYVRKCLIVHLTTEVASAHDEATLSSRLALLRVRTVGGIKIDELGDVPRERQEVR